MRKKVIRLAAVLAALILLKGCTLTVPALDRPTERMPVQELTDVPFFPQRDYECGPAALAEVLTYSGIARSPDDLVAQVYLPGRQGSLQAEMIAAARRHGRLIYPVKTPREMQDQLQAGWPVLVFQNLGLPQYPRWHYAVLVGWEPGRNVILRSGTTRRAVLNEATFLRTWEWGGAWAQVVLAPGQLPARADPDRYLAAAWNLESIGQTDAALSAYQAATRRWPADDLTWLARSNLLLDAQGAAAALDAITQGLRHNPDSDALRLNKAGILLALGQPADALPIAREIASRDGVWREQAAGLLRRIEAGDGA